jgi:choline-glycine betaine transporter
VAFLFLLTPIKTHMLNKAFIIILATLAFIYLATVIFEYCLNEASSTELTTAGFLMLLVIIWLYASLIYRFLKKRPTNYD